MTSNQLSNQLQWAAISGAAALGLGLLIYDIKTKSVETTVNTNVKLKIEEVDQTSKQSSWR
jgi:hypothetical protein